MQQVERVDYVLSFFQFFAIWVRNVPKLTLLLHFFSKKKKKIVCSDDRSAINNLRSFHENVRIERGTGKTSKISVMMGTKMMAMNDGDDPLPSKKKEELRGKELYKEHLNLQ